MSTVNCQMLIVNCPSALRPQDSDELIPLPLHLLFDFGDIREPRQQCFELGDGVLLVAEFAAPQAHAELHEVALGKEFLGAIAQTIEIVPVRAKPEPEHLHLHVLAVALLFLFFLLELIEVVTDLADLHHRRNGFGRDLDQIELGLPRPLERFGRRENLGRAVIRDEHHLRSHDLGIDTGFSFVFSWRLKTVSLAQTGVGERLDPLYGKRRVGSITFIRSLE